MDRKKELKQQYKLMKPKMGVFIVRCKANEKCYIQATKDLRGVMNGCEVRLAGGTHPYVELQREYTALGPENFEMEILEVLPYDEDETKTDYTEDLEIARMIWEDKLAKEGRTFYRKRLQG
jgi:hypothetical protein